MDFKCDELILGKKDADSRALTVHNTEYGFLRTALAGDTLDNSNGFI